MLRTHRKTNRKDRWMHQLKLIPLQEDQRPFPHEHTQGTGILSKGSQLGEPCQGQISEGQRAVGGDHRARDTGQQEDGRTQCPAWINGSHQAIAWRRDYCKRVCWAGFASTLEGKCTFDQGNWKIDHQGKELRTIFEWKGQDYLNVQKHYQILRRGYRWCCSNQNTTGGRVRGSSTK